MTRERYKEYMIRRWSRNISYMEEEMSRDIDKIFDDIDSRVCENCKYVETEGGIILVDSCCTNRLSVAYGELVFVQFGCNQFERKLEPK